MSNGDMFQRSSLVSFDASHAHSCEPVPNGSSGAGEAAGAGRQDLQDLAQRVLDECRTSLMMAMRYLDVAFWKMPFEVARFEGALGTDGMRLKFNPANVIERFKLSPNEMTRDFLHLVLHCVFRQPFETRRDFPMLWSYACDLCVENIAMEMCGARFASPRDADRAMVLDQLRKHVSALTPAQIYRLMERLRASDASTTREEKQLAQLLRESEALFIRDSHDFWNLSKSGSNSDSDENEEGDDPQQSNDEEGSGATAEDADSENDLDEEGGKADADQGDAGEGGSGGEGEGNAPESSEPSPDSDDQKNRGNAEESDSFNDSGAGESDGAEGGGQSDESTDEGAASDGNSQELQQESDVSQTERQHGPNESSAQSDASHDASERGKQNDSTQRNDGARASASASAQAGASANPQNDVPYEEALNQDTDPEQAERDWENISKQIEADLQTMSQQRGSGAGDMLANLEIANRNRIDYADFLRQFARMGEDMRLNDDEFDYVYYMYGLERYGNMPLVEPLEYKESNRVREFVIALDTSGSCSGDLVRRFVVHTFEILKSSEEFGSQVNIHVVQCDAEIQKDTVITSVDDFTRYLDSFEVAGFGGTDFRPVFAYVDDLVRQGEFEDLRGLIYFTDGAGIYPDAPPDYDVAFVFVDEAGEQRRVPPWAMRVVMDEESIRQLQ